MKTIEEAAKEYANRIDKANQEWVQEDFKAGIEFAQRWIPVEDELPLNKDNAKMVLVKLLCEPHKPTRVSSPPNTKPFVMISMGVYDHYLKKWSIIHHLIENKFHAESYKVTHWRYIDIE